MVTPRRELAWQVAARVVDPELPMVTLADLGILRDVTTTGSTATVTITPTYTGCPAMAEIAAALRDRLERAGFDEVKVRTALSPPWSSDWISVAGRAKLTAAGIAPPTSARRNAAGPIPLRLVPTASIIPCPRCNTTTTSETAAFGATACRSLHRCDACLEPFDAIKAI